MADADALTLVATLVVADGGAVKRSDIVSLSHAEGLEPGLGSA